MSFDAPASLFITDFNRVIRGLKPISVAKLKAREPACIRALLGCRSGEKADAVNAMEPFANRQITEDAEWVYDDFLLFAMLCVFVRFGEFRDTITALIAFRRRNEQPAVTTFLHDAERIGRTASLDGGSMYDVTIANILERAAPSIAVVRQAYRQATNARQEPRLSTFEEAISRRVEEIATELSIESTASAAVVARHLWNRCHGAAIVLCMFALVVALGATGWLIWTYFFGEEKPSSVAEKLVSLGAVGVLSVMWGARRPTISFISFVLVWLLTGSSGWRAMRALNSGTANAHKGEKGVRQGDGSI